MWNTAIWGWWWLRRESLLKTLPRVARLRRRQLCERLLCGNSENMSVADTAACEQRALQSPSATFSKRLVERSCELTMARILEAEAKALNHESIKTQCWLFYPDFASS
jgi:hypothetical protein